MIIDEYHKYPIISLCFHIVPYFSRVDLDGGHLSYVFLFKEKTHQKEDMFFFELMNTLRKSLHSIYITLKSPAPSRPSNANPTFSSTPNGWDEKLGLGVPFQSISGVTNHHIWGNLFFNQPG